MHKSLSAVALALVLVAPSAQADSKLPDLTGTWECDPAPMLIRGEWTTLKYAIEIGEQREHLFKGKFSWTLPEKNDVEGEAVTGKKSFEGEWTALGVIGWDGTSVEIVSLDDLQRHSGILEGTDTIRFVHSKVGDDAWVSRSTCRR
jgi:hypothetical protein